MKGWNNFEGDDAEWDKIIVSTGQNILYNQQFWINLKRNENWNIDRLCYLNNKSEIKLILVIFKKKYSFFNYLWSSGGLSNSNIDYLDVALSDLKLYLNNNYVNYYFRMNSIDLFSAEKNYYFSKHLYIPKHLISSGFTVINNLSLSIENILNNLNSKKRYTIKSAIKQNIIWKIGLSDSIVSSTKFVFEKFKNESIRKFKLPSNEEIEYLSTYKNHFLFIVGEYNDVPITVSIINVTNQYPLYLYAATTEDGRKIGASYAMICQLHTFLNSMGYEKFDLLGISPFEKDIAGIDKFKLSFSGEITKYNGEWEYGSKLFRILGNLIIKIRK